ncbi:hypothetical protein BaRGS_00013675 [Batillaria attramentaria]|uniref:Uncharacterized protein n=1 Tax=Batillaria attramentaria TaxID=370345 RepID=A0ABD0L6S6_9CAEN
MMSSRETNRLHRWAMWRMTVNEGIISCLRENGTHRVLSPDSQSDQMASPLHELPFLAADQLHLARRLNLREKYGSIPGLSDDAYFIFGLPRISVGNDIPEVTSTAGTRSMYGSVSDFDAIVFNGTRAEPRHDYLSTTYSELGPTPDDRSMVSNNDFEVQRINGYREEWRNLASPPLPARLNLRSIQEEHDHGRERIETYPFNVSPSRTESYLPSPTSSPRRSDFYPPSPTSPNRHRGFDYTSPQHQTFNSYSPSSPMPGRSYSPSPGPPRGWGSGYSPYANRQRPTTSLSDDHTERMKREAYYDWDEGARMADRYMPDFISPVHHRYS